MRDNENIKMFVRQTLGCACPEEVFEYIDCRYNIKLDNDIFLGSKINIGNRLLIYVVEVSDSKFVKSNLSTLVYVGKNERDGKGFNRFRLVTGTDKMNEIKQAADGIFKALDDRDEKVYLHIVNRNKIPIFSNHQN